MTALHTLIDYGIIGLLLLLSLWAVAIASNDGSFTDVRP